MTKALVLICIILSHFSYAQSTKSYKDLLGKWHGKDSQTIGVIEFIDESKVTMLINGQSVDIDSYKADFTNKPIILELTSKGLSKYCVLQFIDDETIKLQIFSAEKRMTDFVQDAGHPAIILRRKKQP